jgi:uncharacterized protein (DUF433 family)
MRQYTIIDRGRGPELEGTRITVYDIIPYLRLGWCSASIALLFGIGSLGVEALTRYIEEHKDEVMAENAKIEERIARGNPPEIEEKLKGSRERLLALREELRRKRLQEVNGAGDPERPQHPGAPEGVAHGAGESDLA